MLTRVVGVPAAALVLLVAAPGLVVRVVNPPAKPTAPTGAVTLHLTGGSGDSFIRVRTTGTPDKAGVHLVDSDGLHAAIGFAVAGANCNGARIRRAGAGTDDWCLHVLRIPAGHQVSGTFTGGTNLTVTIVRRDGYCWPIFILFLGFAAALVVPWLSKRLKYTAGELAISRLLDRNDGAGANRVTDARTWVHERLDEDASLGDVYTTLEGVFAKGPAQVRTSRKSLADALLTTRLPADNPYRAAAAGEAGRTDFVMRDFADKDGKALRTTKASDFLASLPAVEDAAAKLATVRDNISEHLVPGPCTDTPTEVLERALAVLATVDAPDKVETLAEPVAEARAAYERATQRPGCLKGARVTVEETVGAGAEAVAAEKIIPRPSPLDVRRTRLSAWIAFAVSLTGIAIAVVYLFGGATVWEAAYDPKVDFSGFVDYFTLFSAAFASGAAASTLAFLAAWRPKPSPTPA
jgi:hypothetical protein